MSSRRTLILIGAVVIGALAAFLTLNYVRGVENENAEENQLVEVLVAAQEIPKGTASEQALDLAAIAPAERRRADLPVGAVTRPAEIQGQISTVDLQGGEIITTSMFASESDTSGSKAVSLDEGNVAITISVDEAAGVAGLIQPGDSINILASVRPGEDAEGGGEQGGLSGAGGGYGLSTPSVYAFQAVNVLAVGQSLGEPVAEGEEAPQGGSGMITVQLPPAEAALLAGIRDASLYLTLNRPDYEPVPVPFSPIVPTLPGEQGVSPYPDEPAESDGQ